MGELGTAASVGERQTVRRRYREVGEVPSIAVSLPGEGLSSVVGRGEPGVGFEGGTPIAMVPKPACVAYILVCACTPCEMIPERYLGLVPGSGKTFSLTSSI